MNGYVLNGVTEHGDFAQFDFGDWIPLDEALATIQGYEYIVGILTGGMDKILWIRDGFEIQLDNRTEVC
jgi:hypothetical protein